MHVQTNLRIVFLFFPGVPSEGLPSGVFSASAARPAASVAGGSASSEGRPLIGPAPAGGYSMRKT